MGGISRKDIMNCLRKALEAGILSANTNKWDTMRLVLEAMLSSLPEETNGDTSIQLNDLWKIVDKLEQRVSELEERGRLNRVEFDSIENFVGFPPYKLTPKEYCDCGEEKVNGECPLGTPEATPDRIDCPRCKGEQLIGSDNCPKCLGLGWVQPGATPTAEKLADKARKSLSNERLLSEGEVFGSDNTVYVPPAPQPEQKTSFESATRLRLDAIEDMVPVSVPRNPNEKVWGEELERRIFLLEHPPLSSSDKGKVCNRPPIQVPAPQPEQTLEDEVAKYLEENKHPNIPRLRVAQDIIGIIRQSDKGKVAIDSKVAEEFLKGLGGQVYGGQVGYTFTNLVDALRSALEVKNG